MYDDLDELLEETFVMSTLFEESDFIVLHFFNLSMDGKNSHSHGYFHYSLINGGKMDIMVPVPTKTCYP